MSHQRQLSSCSPFWIHDKGPKSGLAFICPCGCDRTLIISWDQPLSNGARWQRIGESFSELTVTPGINAADTPMGYKRNCRFNGQLINGVLSW